MEISTSNNIIYVSNTPTLGYKYVHFLQKLNNKDTLLKDYSVTDNVSNIILPEDGLYNVTSVRIINSNVENSYYIEDDEVFDNLGNLIVVEDLLNVTHASLIKETEVTFLIYYLKNFYTNLLESKIFKNIYDCNCQESKTDKVLIDTLTMGLEVLKILVEHEQFHEAQRIVEKLTTCNKAINLNCNCNA